MFMYIGYVTLSAAKGHYVKSKRLSLHWRAAQVSVAKSAPSHRPDVLRESDIT
jgi:hypothetical protein